MIKKKIIFFIRVEPKFNYTSKNADYRKKGKEEEENAINISKLTEFEDFRCDELVHFAMTLICFQYHYSAVTID